jgi:hypothetical protein
VKVKIARKRKGQQEKDRADETWINGKISGVEMETPNEAFCSLLSTLQAEQTKKYTKATENTEANVQVSDVLSDEQQTVDSSADGRMSPGQATEALKKIAMRVTMIAYQDL